MPFIVATEIFITIELFVKWFILSMLFGFCENWVGVFFSKGMFHCTIAVLFQLAHEMETYHILFLYLLIIRPTPSVSVNQYCFININYC